MSAPSTPASGAGTDQLRARLVEQLNQAAEVNPPSPLSFAQQRLWFLDQLEPDSPLYNIPSVARLTGPLHLSALEHAINAIVARHESLRTRFINRGGEPVQVVEPALHLQIPVEDLSSCPEPEREARMHQRVEQHARRPFNLSTDTLLRATLLRLAPEDHLLILNMHHIVSDEWSYGIFYGELAQFYAGFSQGRPVDLPELPIQYADFAHWQHDWLQSKACAEQLRFWKKQLSGAPLALDLPTDRRPGSTPTSNGATQCLQLEPQLSQRLKHLARSRHATLFMLVLAAFKTLLYHVTRRDDLIVGVPVSGRSRIETEGVIGFFVNTVPLRTRLSGEMTFQELLARERETALGAFSNQELPFDKLVEALRPERSSNQTPFINVLFIFQGGLTRPIELPGLSLRFLSSGTGTSKFDLTLSVCDSPEGLVLGTEYSTDLFEAKTIARWLEDLEALLGGIVADPTQRLCDLPPHGLEQRYPRAQRSSPPASAELDSALSSADSQLSTHHSLNTPTPPAAEPDGAPPGPRDDTERRLQQLWQEVLEVRPIGLRDKFFALGGHSLLAVRLVAEVERVFGKKLRVSSVFKHPTIEQFATLLRDGSSPRSQSALVEIQPHGSRPPLMLVHGAGGGMFWGYSNLARHLGTDQPLLAFKSRGLDGLEEFTTIQSMAEAYLADLRTVQPKGPYYLGGYCFGGVVAFEIAQRLHARGERVALLALLNSGAPNSSYAQFQWTPTTTLRFALNLGRRLAHFASCPTDKLLSYLRWKMGILLNRVRGQLRGAAAKRIQTNVDDWLDLTQFGADQRQVWHTHIHALEQYTPRPYPGPVTLFRSPVHGLYCSYDPKCGWGDYARGGVSLKLIPGAHETIMEEPGVRRLAIEMHRVLSQSQLLHGAPRSAAHPDTAPSRSSDFLVRSNV